MSKHVDCEQDLKEHREPFEDLKCKENQQAALALLLGPETETHLRIRAMRRLARRGLAVFPLVLTTLNNYPEITTPAWPWWPPQYKYSSRLLSHLAQKAQIALADLLAHPVLTQPAGPVLWISVIEAISFIEGEHDEALLQKSLETPWETVRYAAAMALATRPHYEPLSQQTLQSLQRHLSESEALPVRLTAAYALLTNGKEREGINVLLEAISPGMTDEVKKAAAFILATELPCKLTRDQHEHLTGYLFQLLQDKNIEIAQLAAHALNKIAEHSMLFMLYKILSTSTAQHQIIVLGTLEEMAQHQTMRLALQQQGLLTPLLPYVQSNFAEVRRQASYTLAAYGGDYVVAALGSVLLQKQHPGRLEVIESLRHLHNIHKAPIRTTVARWLLQLLHTQSNEIKIAVLDSLMHILWQARLRKQKQAWNELCIEILQEDIILELLVIPNPWVRQQTVDLLRMLGQHVASLQLIQQQLINLLCTDKDSGVRASVAYTCGQLKMLHALPELLHALLDEDENVAITAMNALCQMTKHEHTLVCAALKELCYLIDDANPIFSLVGKEALDCYRKILVQVKRRQKRERLHTSG